MYWGSSLLLKRLILGKCIFKFPTHLLIGYDYAINESFKPQIIYYDILSDGSLFFFTAHVYVFAFLGDVY